MQGVHMSNTYIRDKYEKSWVDRIKNTPMEILVIMNATGYYLSSCETEKRFWIWQVEIRILEKKILRYSPRFFS
jgi:hypothetical protein